MKKYVLAHDLGTSGNKATLFDENGTMVCNAVSAYKTAVFHTNWAEQDPADWWSAVCRSTQEVLSHIDPSQLVGVAFSGQMMACLCVDSAGLPLHKAMIYCDQRSGEQERRLIDELGMKAIYAITGHRPSASYTLAKLMWIREHHPEVYARTYKVLQAKDYMNFRLTGEYSTDFNDASGTNAFDLTALKWSDDILKSVAVPQALFPDAFPSITTIGKVHHMASVETGIPEGTPVMAGSGDGGCATLGAGSVTIGKPYCYMGSSSWVSVTSSAPLFDSSMRSFTWAHPIEGLYQPCATMQTAGSSFSWFASVFKGSADDLSLEGINRSAAESVPGAHGVVFLPYLLGERSPWWDSHAKACFVGMNMNTTWADLCRAVIEGIALNLNFSLEMMLQQVDDRTIGFIGGGAQGAIWRKIFADVFGCRVRIPTLLTEATSMGAALLGGVGVGLYSDFNIVESMNPTNVIVDYDSSLQDLYQRKSLHLRNAYQNLADLFGQMDAENA